MLQDPFDKWPQPNESWAEMKQRQQKESQVSDKVAILLLFFVIAPFVIWLVFEALDKAAK